MGPDRGGLSGVGAGFQFSILQTLYNTSVQNGRNCLWKCDWY